MSNALRIGLIGCGGIVRRTHAPAYVNLKELVHVVGIADLFAENLNAVGAQLQVPKEKRFEDYRRLLKDVALDAVVIATPHHLHREHIEAAAQAGVHIVTEKPLTTGLNEADEILRCVEKYKVKLGVIHNLLFTPSMLAAVQAVKTELGAIHFARGQSLFDKRIQSFDDYAQQWRMDRNAGGGCIADTCYHEIYCTEALAASPIVRVFGQVRASFFEHGIDDLVLLQCEHADGGVSTVSSSWCVNSGQGRSCEAHGRNGSIRVIHADDLCQQYALQTGKWSDRSVTVTVTELPVANRGHQGFFEATFKALRVGTALPVDGRAARHNLAIIDAARRSSLTKSFVNLEE